jgi:hypothetical protein
MINFIYHTAASVYFKKMKNGSFKGYFPHYENSSEALNAKYATLRNEV